MKTIRTLLLNASPHGSASHARQLVDELLTSMPASTGSLSLRERDLVSTPLPALDARYATAVTSHAAPDVPRFALSEQLIAELENSERLLILTPMHNFTVPAALKLWIDHVLRIHRSFESTPQGKRGLLADRPTLVLVSSGGQFQGAQAQQPDFLTPYLRHVLHTLGVYQVDFLALQGLTREPAALAQTIAQARQQLRQHPFFTLSLSPERIS